MSFLEYQPVYQWKNRVVPKSMRKFPLFMLETVPFKLSQKPKSPQTFKQPPTLRIASEKHNPRILYPIDRTSSWFPSFKSIVRKVVKRNEIDDAFWLIDFYLDNPKSSSLKPLFVLLYELNQKRLLSTYSKNVDLLLLKLPQTLKEGVTQKILAYQSSSLNKGSISSNLDDTAPNNNLQLKPSIAPVMIEKWKSNKNMKEIVKLIKEFNLHHSPSVQMALLDSFSASCIPEKKLTSDLNIFHQLKSHGAIMSQEIANRLTKSFANANLPLVALSFSKEILSRHSLPIYKKTVDAIVFSILRMPNFTAEEKKLLQSVWEISGANISHSKRRLVQITRACFKVQDYETLNSILDLVKKMEPEKCDDMLYHLSKSVGKMNSAPLLDLGFNILKTALDKNLISESHVSFHLHYLDGVCSVFNLFSYFKFLIDRKVRIANEMHIDKINSVFSKLSGSKQGEISEIGSQVIYIVNEAVDQISSSDASISILDSLFESRAARNDD